MIVAAPKISNYIGGNKKNEFEKSLNKINDYLSDLSKIFSSTNPFIGTSEKNVVKIESLSLMYWGNFELSISIKNGQNILTILYCRKMVFILLSLFPLFLYVTYLLNEYSINSFKDTQNWLSFIILLIMPPFYGRWTQNNVKSYFYNVIKESESKNL